MCTQDKLRTVFNVLKDNNLVEFNTNTEYLGNKDKCTKIMTVSGEKKYSVQYTDYNTGYAETNEPSDLQVFLEWITAK